MQPFEALDRIAFLLERSNAPSYRVQAFRKAAVTISRLGDEKLRELDAHGRLKSLGGVGDKTSLVIHEALAGGVPAYLADLEKDYTPEVDTGNALRQALRGDCHTHSLWSDGGSPIIDMARAARTLGHEYIVLTDHSPRLTVANGLTAQRLRSQLEEVAQVNATLADEATDEIAPFRVLTGIEVDINEDGTLDQEPELLAELDLVVASVHSKLRADSKTMTKRMLRAIEDPHINVLGHCTGRKVVQPLRPPSEFDADAVFRACAERGVAVEINARPERKDPPRDLLRQAVDLGCIFTIDTDAHAPGQLTWQYIGCERAEECGVTEDRVMNTKSADNLLAVWA